VIISDDAHAGKYFIIVIIILVYIYITEWCCSSTKNTEQFSWCCGGSECCSPTGVLCSWNASSTCYVV